VKTQIDGAIHIVKLNSQYRQETIDDMVNTYQGWELVSHLLDYAERLEETGYAVDDELLADCEH